MGQDAIFERIRETLRRPDTVLLVGSGVSQWSGLPSWTDLLAELANFIETLGRDPLPVRQEIDQGDLLLAASYAVHQLDERELGSFIRKAIKYGVAVPSKIHQLITALGPSCYITTNYDRLLESTIECDEPTNSPTVVTNRQPTEIADIIPSYSRNFIFKYHGDVGDVASIILSREQYRKILHEYPAAIRAFSTLLATRPVVMIGFGLRDLDFLSVKDELVAAFEGQVGEYFAIMPDFDNVRAEYWRKVYRTEVLSYETIEEPNGKRSHANLQRLLEQLQPERKTPTSAELSPKKSTTAENKLLLARLAARIARQNQSPIKAALPLTVRETPNKEGHYRFSASSLDTLLRNTNESLLLLGLPGAGKTFALKNYAAELANALVDALMTADTFDAEISTPIFVSLALYSGDLNGLLESSLPTGLSLETLLDERHCVVILDSANEAPREFIENEHLIDEIQAFQADHQRCRLIVGSRDESWLNAIELPRFNISDISRDYVIDYFSSQAHVEILSNPELIATLSKPLFFGLAKDGLVQLTEVATPANIYSKFFERVSLMWSRRANRKIDFLFALQDVGFRMLSAGADYAPLNQFQQSLCSSGLNEDEARDAITFLLSQGTLVALTGQRLSFFHQSVAEYLAARVIARDFLRDHETIRNRLRDKRWDQALFLTMSFLDQKDQEIFLDEVLEADLAAATRAVFYIERNQAKIVNKLLAKIAGSKLDFEMTFPLAFQFADIPFREENIPMLQKLAKTHETIGGAAQAALFILQNEKQKSILDNLLKRKVGYNYASSFFVQSEQAWTTETLMYFFEKIKRITKTTEQKKELIERFGEFLPRKLEAHQLLELAKDQRVLKSAAKYALIEALGDVNAPEARRWLLDLICLAETNAIYPLYSSLRDYEETISSSEIEPDTQTAKSLFHLMSLGGSEFAFPLAQALIKLNKNWLPIFESIDLKDSSASFLRELLTIDNPDSFFSLISSVIENPEGFKSYCLRIVGRSEFWKAAPTTTVMNILSTRNSALSESVLSRIQGTQLPLLACRPLDWWLDWAEQCLRSDKRETWWCGFMLVGFIGDADNRTREQLLKRFNEAPEPEFLRLGCLLYMRYRAPQFSTEDFSSQALDRLTRHGRKYPFAGYALGTAATEMFATNVLLPLLKENPNAHWIKEALVKAGQRHNKRYIFT